MLVANIKKYFVLKTILLLLILTALGLALLWSHRNQLIQRRLEKWLNETQSVYFQNTLKIEGFELKKDLRVSIAKIRGTWQTAEGGFHFEINDVVVKDPVTNFMFKQPVEIAFAQFRPKTSTYLGISGKLILANDAAGTTEFAAAFEELYLEELTNFNPDMLKGSTGKVVGTFYLKSQKSGEQQMKLRLSVSPPGGRVQARFFDVLLPYLPVADKATLAKIRIAETVAYKLAHVAAELESKNSLKLLLNIQVPEYNFNLNLNLTLRVEDDKAFIQLAQLLGLAKAENL